MSSKPTSGPGIPWRVLQTGGWVALLALLLKVAGVLQTTLEQLVETVGDHEARLSVLEDRGSRPPWYYRVDERPSK